jgi:hypothetical protein
MSIGPIQIIAFGFERTDQFRGEVLEELANLRGRGLIRLIDLFVAVKDPSGEIIVAEMNDLTQDETVEFGRVIGKLLGKDGVELASNLAAIETAQRAAVLLAWITRDQQVVAKIPGRKKRMMFRHPGVPCGRHAGLAFPWGFLLRRR